MSEDKKKTEDVVIDPKIQELKALIGELYMNLDIAAAHAKQTRALLQDRLNELAALEPQNG
jgi:hypothetical protein